MRVAVYTDYAYTRDAEGVYADRAFALFLAGLSERVDKMLLVGRVSPDPGKSHYKIPDHVRLVELPFYGSLAKPQDLLGSFARSTVRFWRSLPDVDVAWLLGPHPLSLVFAAAARLRGKRVVLGVRQDLPAYARSRHPGRRSFAAAADFLDWTYRLLGRWFGVVVVGPALADRYRRCPRLLEIAVSLVDSEELASKVSPRAYDATELVVLSVGRIEEEKNPLLLADVLRLLSAGSEHRWRFVICGEGPMQAKLVERLREAGVADQADVRGYVRHEELLREYASCHYLLHVSWTEGLPQVLIEAAASRAPIVATDVGGVAAALGGAVSLIPPGDADAAASSLRRLQADEELRSAQVEAGLRYAAAHSMNAELSQLVAFLQPD